MGTTSTPLVQRPEGNGYVTPASVVLESETDAVKDTAITTIAQLVMRLDEQDQALEMVSKRLDKVEERENSSNNKRQRPSPESSSNRSKRQALPVDGLVPAKKGSLYTPPVAKLLSIPKGKRMEQLKWTPSAFSYPDAHGWIYCAYPPNLIRVQDLERKTVSDYVMAMAKYVGEPQSHRAGEVRRVDWRIVKEELSYMRPEVSKRARLVKRDGGGGMPPRTDKETMVEIIDDVSEQNVALALGIDYSKGT
ncbi:hypothetical protein EJ05DRAFT_480802 [Pseudovirgaria hyperparasitica]|uniref:Uncharacterized protein n=1 Tax=Pseudovirgaria hyperparasitica TaxID=470096 RepID=A0A6A6VRY7_9PEZI|nr:uncharacterized protein EJ05DRAFT_480802 [Pseudovirgaria hyperparasitica]KAF2752963.1 hypothetical protein EJ05DRAFT_480802 [Pseudovirgaria hyperparasitica]